MPNVNPPAVGLAFFLPLQRVPGWLPSLKYTP